MMTLHELRQEVAAAQGIVRSVIAHYRGSDAAGWTPFSEALAAWKAKLAADSNAAPSTAVEHLLAEYVPLRAALDEKEGFLRAQRAAGA